MLMPKFYALISLFLNIVSTDSVSSVCTYPCIPMLTFIGFTL